MQHYVYSTRSLPLGLQRAVRGLYDSIPRYDDQRMVFELQRLMVFLGDGHTYCVPWSRGRVRSRVVPLAFYLFSDGLYVIDAAPGLRSWIGSRVDRFGVTPTADAFQGLDQLVSRDNPMGIAWVGPVYLRFPGALAIVADSAGTDSVRLTLRRPDGHEVDTAFATIPAPPFNGIPKLIPSRMPGAGPVPRYLAHLERRYWYTDLDRASVYVQFNQVLEEPGEPLDAFSKRLGARLASGAVDTVIVDVRHNSGGQAELASPLTWELNRYHRKHPDGVLIVLTGRNTFSAAQIFISQLDRTAAPIFAGEPSSSKPNFVGEQNEVRLPWSGLTCSISNRYHETIPGDERPWIEPDIRVELSSRDYFANRDPVMDSIRGRDR